MRCPRCETVTLDEKDREGVVVDVCAQCRGVWLDRGELEKLIARAARDLDELDQQRNAPPPSQPQQRSYPPPDPHFGGPPQPYPPRSKRDSDPDYRYPQHADPRYQQHGDPRYQQHHDPRYRHHRKKSFLESLGDIFD